MKISIERGTLLKAVSQAQSVVERRNTIPILANVLIEAEAIRPCSAPPTWISKWSTKPRRRWKRRVQHGSGHHFA